MKSDSGTVDFREWKAHEAECGLCGNTELRRFNGHDDEGLLADMAPAQQRFSMGPPGATGQVHAAILRLSNRHCHSTPR